MIYVVDRAGRVVRNPDISLGAERANHMKTDVGQSSGVSALDVWEPGCRTVRRQSKTRRRCQSGKTHAADPRARLAWYSSRCRHGGPATVHRHRPGRAIAPEGVGGNEAEKDGDSDGDRTCLFPPSYPPSSRSSLSPPQQPRSLLHPPPVSPLTRTSFRLALHSFPSINPLNSISLSTHHHYTAPASFPRPTTYFFTPHYPARILWRGAWWCRCRALQRGCPETDIGSGELHHGGD